MKRIRAFLLLSLTVIFPFLLSSVPQKDQVYAVLPVSTPFNWGGVSISVPFVNVTIVKDYNSSNGKTIVETPLGLQTNGVATHWSFSTNYYGTYQAPGAYYSTAMHLEGVGFYETQGTLVPGVIVPIHAFVENTNPAGIYDLTINLLNDGPSNYNYGPIWCVITVLEPSPSPSSTPTVSNSPTPTFTITPTPTSTPTPTPTYGFVLPTLPTLRWSIPIYHFIIPFSNIPTSTPTPTGNLIPTPTNQQNPFSGRHLFQSYR